MRSALRTRFLWALAPVVAIGFGGVWLAVGSHRLGPGTFVAAYLIGMTAAVHWTEPRRRRVLIVGGGPIATALVDEIGARPNGRYRLIGVVDDAPDEQPTPGLVLRLGSMASLARIIDATRPDEIAITLTHHHGDTVTAGPLLDARLRGVVIQEAVQLLERLTGKIAIEAIDPDAILFSSGFRHSDAAHSDLFHAVTRAWNLVVAAIVLVLLSPVLLAITVLIVLDSSGSPFFVQRRVGAGGLPFGLIKFRTMRDDDGPHSEWVRDNESRITRVGKWLRRFRLDELPQLVNVLRGEMNFVGPRPHPASNYPLFCDRIPLYVCRGSVRPGITGWAHVRYGYANGLDEETEKMRYDLYYIKHRSISFDARILIETVLVVLVDRACSAMQGPARDAAWAGPWSQAASGVYLR